MNKSIKKKIGAVTAAIALAAFLLIIVAQPQVGTPQAIGPERAHGNTPEQEAEGTQAEQVKAPNVKIEILMEEFGFTVDGKAANIPSGGTVREAAPITVQVGDVLQFTLSNTGKILHEFNIALGEGEHQHLEGMEHQAESMMLTPGETEIMIFVAERTGEYIYHCSIPGHTELGMVGTLVVIGEDAPIEHDDEDHHEE